MAKVKHSVATRRRKKRTLKQAKGFWGDRSKQYQQARRALMHALKYAYRDRRTKKYAPCAASGSSASMPPVGRQVSLTLSSSAGSKMPRWSWTGRYWRISQCETPRPLRR
jgi:hypothetical protein